MKQSYNKVTSTLLCVPYWSDFSRIVHAYGEQATFSQVKVAKYGDFDFGADLSETEGFCSEKYSGTGSSLRSRHIPKPSHLGQLLWNTILHRN